MWQHVEPIMHTNLVLGPTALGLIRHPKVLRVWNNFVGTASDCFRNFERGTISWHCCWIWLLLELAATFFVKLRRVERRQFCFIVHHCVDGQIKIHAGTVNVKSFVQTQSAPSVNCPPRRCEPVPMEFQCSPIHVALRSCIVQTACVKS